MDTEKCTRIGVVFPINGTNDMCIVDLSDLDLAFIGWQYTSNGYVVADHTRIHRLIMARVLARDLLPQEMVDHIDGDTLNNRRVNLRIVTPKQNSQNRKRHSNNRSGFKGVTYKTTTGKWGAQIRVNGKQMHLGYFDTVEEAYSEYRNASLKYFGKFARK